MVSPRGFAGSVPVHHNAQSPFCIFTKCLPLLNYDLLGEVIANAGFDGADLNVRKDGNVFPENVKTDLPKAIKQLNKSGIKVPMMVTRINNPDDEQIESVLGTAAELGIRHYRMGYLNYDPAKSIQESLDGHKRTMEKLEKINRRFGIHGEYQNHTGTRVGGSVWDMYWILKDTDPQYIGVQYDIRHAVCEGGNSWPVGMKLLAPWIKTTVAKDFIWIKKGERWSIKDVPLGEGQVNFNAYLEQYKALGLSGPVSVHYEYDVGKAEQEKANNSTGLNSITGILKRDLDWLKTVFKQHHI